MHYFNNPIKTYNKTVLPYGLDTDPIVKSMHCDQHVLFYHSKFNHQLINYQQKLQDFCNWANNRDVILNSAADGDLDWIANIVKFNMWVTDIKTQGIVKPMLIYYDGEFTSGTGESRLRTLECIPEVAHVTAFITTHQQHAHKFSHLEQVTRFARFAEICKATLGQQFMFRFTDANAPWGLDWYEYDSELTRVVTPSQDYCVSAVRQYLEQYPDTVFNKDWFVKLVDWQGMKESNPR
jgi:hypothetical protein